MIEHAALTWLINALWIVPLAALAAAVCLRIGRPGPRLRHGVWMAALALAVCLPAAPRITPPAFPSPAAHPMTVPAGALPAQILPEATNLAVQDAPPPELTFDPGWTRAVLGLAGLIVAIALIRLLIAIAAGQRLARSARPADLDPGLWRLLNRVAADHGRRPPPVLECDAIAGPAVVGALAPAILIPSGFRHAPPDEQAAALLHELAHVLRHDYAWNLLCEAASLPAAWHPALAAIKAGVRRSREAACDAMAARAMASPGAYAKCLVSLAGRLGAVEAGPAMLVGLIGKSDLEERLMSLLDARPRGAAAVLRLGVAASFALVALVPLVLLRVTPARADEPAVAHRLILPARAEPAPVAVAAEAAPARPPAPPIPAPRASVAARAALAAAPPAPPAPAFDPEDAAAEAAPPAPPEPPAPPAVVRAPQADGRAALDSRDALIQRTLDAALRAEQAAQSAATRRALAALEARQAEVMRAESVRIRQEMSRALAELDRARLEPALAELKARLNSPAVRDAIERAAREAAKAAAEAEAAARQSDDPKD